MTVDPIQLSDDFFPPFRAALNAALETLASNFKSTTIGEEIRDGMLKMLEAESFDPAHKLLAAQQNPSGDITLYTLAEFWKGFDFNSCASPLLSVKLLTEFTTGVAADILAEDNGHCVVCYPDDEGYLIKLPGQVEGSYNLPDGWWCLMTNVASSAIEVETDSTSGTEIFNGTSQFGYTLAAGTSAIFLHVVQAADVPWSDCWVVIPFGQAGGSSSNAAAIPAKWLTASGVYPLVAADQGLCLVAVNATGVSLEDDPAPGGWPAGFVCSLFNMSASDVTISLVSGAESLLLLVGVGVVTSITVPPMCEAFIHRLTSSTWKISGVGIS